MDLAGPVLIVAAMLLLSGDRPDEFLHEVKRVRQMFRDASLRRGGIYETMAILILRIRQDGAPITPGNFPSDCSTSFGSIPRGVPASVIDVASVRRPHVPHKITPAMIMLVMGSIHKAPV